MHIHHHHYMYSATCILMYMYITVVIMFCTWVFLLLLKLLCNEKCTYNMYMYKCIFYSFANIIYMCTKQFMYNTL